MKKMSEEAQIASNGGAYQCKICGRTHLLLVSGVYHVVSRHKKRILEATRYLRRV